VAQNDSPTAVQFLEQQHEEIRQLFGQLETATGDERREIFTCLVRLLAVHETAEEEVVHPAVRAADGGREVVELRLKEEAEAKQALSELEQAGPDAPDFSTRLTALRTAVESHASSEEQQEFTLLRNLHDQDALRGMTTLLKAAEAIAPTHPHPHGPESAIGNLAVGPFVAVADRVRDAISSARR